MNLSEELRQIASQLPDWCLWLAQDSDGNWWVYEAEPHLHERGWYENEVGRSLLVLKGVARADWRESLRATRDLDRKPI